MKRFLFTAISLLLISTASIAQNRLPKVEKDNLQSSLSDMDRGFWISADAEVGTTFRIENTNSGFTGVNVTGGYRFSEYLKVGVGFGWRYYFKDRDFRNESTQSSYPIYANVRGNIISSQYRTVVPYYSVNVGGSIKDGFMFKPTIGMRIGEYSRHSFLVGVSYLGQTMNTSSKGNRYVSGVSLNIGYEF